MIRFAKHYFENIGGIELYPIISLVLFFTVFSVMVLMVLKIPKKAIKDHSELPLDTKN